jgi:hypothetical protein
MHPAMAMAIKFVRRKEISADRIVFGFMLQLKARGVP